jgi:hypothetical protein
MLGQPGAVLMVLDTPTGLQDALARMSVMAELLLVGDPPQGSLPVGGDAVRRPDPLAPGFPADDTEGEQPQNADHHGFHDLTPELLFTSAA